MIFRYLIETLPRRDQEAADERLRELGLENWEMVGVLPGTRADPDDREHFTLFFKRDASTDIGL